MITDKATGKSKSYGVVTYKDIELLNNELREPMKFIDVSYNDCVVLRYELATGFLLSESLTCMSLI